MSEHSFSTDELKNSFFKQGFIHIRNLLGDSEVSELRKGLMERFKIVAKKKKIRMIHTLPPSHCFNDSLIYDLVLRKDIKNYLATILGHDYELIPDLEVHKNSFGLKNSSNFISNNNTSHCRR